MILFGIFFLLWAMCDPWFPPVGEILTELAPYLGLFFAVAGVVTVCRGDEKEKKL